MTPLITAAELAQLMTTVDDIVVLDVRWQLSGVPGAGAQHAAYVEGHIPGARFIDLETVCTDHTATGQGRHPLPRPDVFEAAMRAAGVDAMSTVVVYDAANSMAAARLWWLLTDAGQERVRVLNGGFAAWLAAGGAVEAGEVQPATPTQWVAKTGRRSRVSLADIEATRRAGAMLIDVRAPERFRGDTEPLDPVAGHIPGAVNVPISRVQNPDGSLKSPEEVRTVLHARPGDVFYCGSGITASLALLAFEAAGGEGALIYPGSWSQWSSAGGPVETGDPRGGGESD